MQTSQNKECNMKKPDSIGGDDLFLQNCSDSSFSIIIIECFQLVYIDFIIFSDYLPSDVGGFNC